MLKIKLTPLGKRDHHFYRLVVTPDRSKLTGQYLSLLGTYDPHHPENKLNYDRKAYQLWLEKGAQPTATVKKLVSKNP
jgi:small subunit ribosomal protein S16